jgi:hypothetical protein
MNLTANRRDLAPLIWIFLLAALAYPETPAKAASGNDSLLVRDFESRVSHYLQQLKKQAGDSPGSMNSVEKLNQSQKAAAQKTKATRQQARQGDVFTPKIAGYFRRQIHSAFQGPQGKEIRASLRNAEPLPDVLLKVNQVYPQQVPLQSTPPTLLQDLPPLPKELEYRIVGHHLVLLDLVPKLVVDFIPNALGSAED